MKIELSSFPNCIHAEAFRIFLAKNNIPFKEIEGKENKVSFLKIIRNHGILVLNGFDEEWLNLNLVEHIKKYKPRLEK